MATKSVEQLLREKKIYQIVNPKLVQVPPGISVKEAIEWMQKNRSGYVVIAENKKAIGIFTETDVVRKILSQNTDEQRPVKDFMTPDPFTLTMNDSVGKAIDLMGEKRIYHIPLVDGENHLVNIISVRTIIRFLAECYPAEVLNLPPDPNQVMTTPEGG